MHKMWYLRPVLPALMRLGPAWLRRFFLDLVPLRQPQELKQVADVMDKVVHKSINGVVVCIQNYVGNTRRLAYTIEGRKLLQMEPLSARLLVGTIS
jgi:hypothetical protein